MLARALAQATPLLLLDEPTAHLDPPNKRALFALLFAVAQETGRTIVVSTHDLLPITQQASVWWLLHEGFLHNGAPQGEALRRRIGDALETTV
jgi:iron compound ABC transporter, ATP-binding protein